MLAAALWVRSLKQPQLCGRFDRVADRISNDLPVWKQTAGPGWIYSSKENLWFVTVHEACVGETGGIIGALEPNHRKSDDGDAPPTPPQDTTLWKRWDGPVLGWNESLSPGDVTITASEETGRQWEEEFTKFQQERFVTKPEKLEVIGPDSMMEELKGVFELRTTTTFCAQPVYQNDQGSRMYGDAFGFWRVALAGDALENAGPPGLIQSNDIVAPTQWPDQVSEWMTDGAGCGCGAKKEGEEEEAAEWSPNPDVIVQRISS